MGGMYRAILPDGEIECARFERADHGVELYDGNDDHVAFVPYANLIALLNTEVERGDERSII